MIVKRLMQHHLIVVVVIAVLARGGALLVFPSIFAFDQTGTIHGSTAYDAYALNLLETGVYGREAGVPDATLPPLYSVFLAGIYGVFGRSSLAVGLVHTLLDALSIVLLYHIAYRLFRADPRSRWVGALAGLFFALYPYLIFQNLTLNDTALWIALLHSFLLLMILLRERPDFDRTGLLLALLAGVILGVATLGRALLAPMAVLCALWFLLRLNWRQTVLRLLPVAIVSVLVLLPWMIRSYGIYDALVAVALNSGENVYQGANPQTIPLFRAGYDVQWSSPPPDAGDVQDRYARNQLLMQAGLDYLRENPDRIPELLWVKFLVHWSIDIAPRKNPLPGQSFALDENGDLLVLDDPDANKQDIETIAQYSGGLFETVGRPVHIVYFGGLLLLALAGIGLSLPYWRAVSLLWLVQINMTVMYMIFHPSTRYRSPTDPLLFVFSAYALVWIAVRLRAQNASRKVQTAS